MINRNIVALIVFLFGTTLTFVDIREWIATEFPRVSPLVPYLKYVGAFLLGCLLLIALIELMGWIMEAAARLLPSTLANLALRDARADDLSEVVNLAKRQIGDQITLENTIELYNHNPKCLKKLVNTKSNSIVGYFCILPLTQKGEQQVLERDLIHANLDLDCFAKNFRKRTPVYIGSLAAEGLRSRAATLQMMKTFLVSKEVSKAFARPATKHGVRLVKRYEFEPVNDHDWIDEGVYVIRVAPTL